MAHPLGNSPHLKEVLHHRYTNICLIYYVLVLCEAILKGAQAFGWKKIFSSCKLEMYSINF